MKKRSSILLCIVLAILLFISVGINIYQAFWGFESYLQDTEQIYIMEAGILRNNLEFESGENYEFSYDFENEEYPVLIEKYDIDEIAGDGTEFEKALRLMNEYAPRLYHQSDYDNSVEMNALSLLEYSLDNRKQGINCRNKAQILNEMCLALGIYSRKVWIMPNSGYDNDCHVVNEVWDTELNKWIMLDITNNEYWVDENGMPLSVLEIRYKGAMQEFCTPVHQGDNLHDLERLKEKYIADFLYIMKNMTYMQYCDNYTVGESDTIYLLFPENLNTDYETMISKEACEKSPDKSGGEY
ncbi:MAG: transglutaminase domain-containing protein [Lachnospiraceae bacterium]